jgi:RNA polymerase sigma-70 factor (ECF subfamily)
MGSDALGKPAFALEPSARPVDERDDALVALAERSARRGFAIANRLLGSRAEAEDLVQEALARACEAYDRLRAEALDAWFFRVLTNLCLRTLRRRRLFRWWRGDGEPDAAEPGRDLAVPSGEEARTESAATTEVGCDAGTLLAAVGALAPMQRAVIVLRYGEDLPLAEIAAMLGVKVETVKTHLSRGLAHLRARLGEPR